MRGHSHKISFNKLTTGEKLHLILGEGLGRLLFGELMISRLIGTLAAFYLRLPVKPFRGVLGRLYLKYKMTNKNRTVIATRGGITYELDLNELIDSSIYYEGCFEPLTTAVIDKYVKSGMTVFDIGANIGCHTLRCAKLVGKSGKVIVFEPMSWAFAKLKRNIELNDFNNIIYVEHERVC